MLSPLTLDVLTPPFFFSLCALATEPSKHSKTGQTGFFSRQSGVGAPPCCWYGTGAPYSGAGGPPWQPRAILVRPCPYFIDFCSIPSPFFYLFALETTLHSPSRKPTQTNTKTHQKHHTLEVKSSPNKGFQVDIKSTY